MRPRRLLYLALFVAVFILLLVFTRSRIPTAEDWVLRPDRNPSKCTQDLGWLEKYELTYPIQYASRDIYVNPVAGLARPSVTTLESRLFNDYTTVNVTDLAESKIVQVPHCLPPLTVDVAYGSRPPVDASNIIFGLQTTIGRLKDTVRHLARWLPHTNARLYAMVIEGTDENGDIPANDREMAELEKEFQDQGMKVTIIHPLSKNDRFEQRYFSLVQIMYRARDANTEWVITIDDDTFFPSLHNLEQMLLRYDSSQPHYIGSLSEDWWAVKEYGLMAFGGASIILSTPLAQIIDEHNNECKEHPRKTAGDVTIMDCVYRFTQVKLDNIPALHQVDLHGDLSGFYESGREYLSLHHWKGSFSDYKVEIEKMHLVADICSDCFLQRWQFSDDLVLTNGFSIVKYPEGRLTGRKKGLLGMQVAGEKVEKIDLEQVEETWDEHLDVAHSMAPIRPALGPEKTSYTLLDSFIVSDGDESTGRTVRQVYSRQIEGEQPVVLVLNWHETKNEVNAEAERAEGSTGAAVPSL